MSNAAPSFADQDDRFDDPDTANDVENAGIQVNRSVNENTDVATNIGKPVSASDGDNDTLFYELMDTPDLKDDDEPARFTINGASGQIRVGKKLGADTGQPEDQQTNLDADEVGGALAATNDATNSQYVLRVKATDPSGASRTVNVVIAVNDINEAPNFVDADAPTVLNVEENTIALRTGATGTTDLTGTPYDADDQDANRNLEGTSTEADNEEDATLTVDGADAKYFNITNGGVLSIDETVDGTTTDYQPNYEDKSSYSIAIVATSGAEDRTRRARLDVTVHVIDAEDAGTVTLNAREPQVGRTVVATLTDSDGGVTLSRWTWATSETALTDDQTCAANAGNLLPVEPDVSSGAYTPKAEDNNRCLQATATYTDNIDGDGNDDDTDGNMEMVSFVSEKPVQRSEPDNTAPVFPDQDLTTPGDQSDTASRSVAENMADENVGGSITATDGNQDALLFTLSGDDAASFKTDNNGQIKTKVELDHETRDTYMVMLTATDPSGANDRIMVTVTVTDGPDNAVITGSTVVDYDENGTAPVATFSATDQDGDDIDWSLSGTDEGDFTIDGGVLSFKSSPNYEDPQSGSIGTRADRNVYNVTVQATGGTRAVVVTVVNVDEVGSVSFGDLGQVQPQAGRSLEATVSDPDMGETDEVWQWARSTDMQTWTDIDGGTSARRTPVAADEGHYLRASVTYTDLFGSGKSVYKVTPNKVEERTVSNAAPSFADQDDVEGTGGVQANRSVAENTASGTNIGKPVSASDSDSDVLVYTLSGTDAAKFNISKSTGQLSVNSELNFEAGAGAADNCAENDSCVVTVTATDPSGAMGTATVTITLTDVNEAPEFSAAAKAQTTMTVTELILDTDGVDDLDGNADESDEQATFTANDPDTDPTETVTYSLAGADADSFTLGGNNGELAVATAHRPNYEDKSSYSITIVAQSGTGDRTLRTRLDVTVNVTDAEDLGTVTMSAREPQVDRTVVATLGDPDGGAGLIRWNWATAPATAGTPPTCPVADDGSYTTVTPDVSSGAYTPDGDDVGNCLEATATYTDNLGVEEETAIGVTERPVQTSDPANTAPKFPDQDLTTEGDQSDEAMRSVVENKADENVGGPIDANDTDALLYTLSGDDAASFKVDNAGQIKTKVKLDYETKDMYVVALTASDPSGANDSILVTIMVTDGPDDADITQVTEPDSECVTGGAVDSTASDGLVSDCEALLASEDALGGSLNWDAGTAIADWDGVTVEDGRVTKLRNRSMGLDGTIPADLADLDALVYLMLDRNELTGGIPTELGGLSNLTVLYLHDNDLTGEIPTELGDLSSLMRLYLDDNGLTGSVPSELSQLSNLEYLYLHSNDLTGGIPSELGGLSSLIRLYLHNNGLTGEIPMELGSLSNLRYLILSRNDLTGGIPTELGDLSSNLVLLYLYDNDLTGGIPTELGNLNLMRRLYLHRNMLSGDIPSSLGNLTELTIWRLAGNMLTGCVPGTLANVANNDMAALGLPECANGN